MFSGIIEGKARIISVKGGLFTVENILNEIPTIGQSIAHDGACMTITEANNFVYSFFAMEESLKVTNFGTKQYGDYFNIERCIKVGDRVDGHFVSGHVDTVGTISSIIKNADSSLLLKVNFDKEYKNLIIRKGSVTINGVSLTIIEDGEDFLTVSLIPLTQDITNLGLLKVGDKVNLEFDMMGKYVNKIHSN